ncbi:MAG: 30S ribosomal protein S6 [Peptococcaceae bacterium]|jgi:small subunit ribosomal protein S6|nr:30S ribosomal protein S6 [Peptococcaceae bacterium]
MRNYEIIYILKPDYDEEKVTEIMEKYSNIIKNNQGEIVSEDKWGKRRLAYEIQDYREGFYILVNFKSEANVPTELDRVMKISDEILRFMIINKDEK